MRNILYMKDHLKFTNNFDSKSQKFYIKSQIILTETNKDDAVLNFTQPLTEKRTVAGEVVDFLFSAEPCVACKGREKRLVPAAVDLASTAVVVAAVVVVVEGLGLDKAHTLLTSSVVADRGHHPVVAFRGVVADRLPET